MSYKRYWVALIFVIVASFAVLGGVGRLIKQQTGSFSIGFVLLGVFALMCLFILLRRPSLKLATVGVG